MDEVRVRAMRRKLEGIRILLGMRRVMVAMKRARYLGLRQNWKENFWECGGWKNCS